MSPALRIAVIGAGMSGLLSVIKLKEAGFGEVTVYEKADRLGGTWRENTYPGVACDVPSHLYCYSFAPNPDWSHAFAPGAEIRAYLERVAAEHRFDDHVRYGQEVTRLAWEGGRWHLTTAGGLTDVADVVIGATGVLHHPRFPDIPGLGSFAGACFHSARWDHRVRLDGARVGVIGTGSSAIQIVPAVVDQVAEVRLFQRTAQWILPVDNPPVSDEDRAALRADPAAAQERRDALCRLFAENFANVVTAPDSAQMQAIEAMCRQNLEEHVADPELRERLRPTYRAACKRLVISPNFYAAIQHPRAGLVTDAIAGVEPAGVRTVDGTLHPLDVLVLATGFRVDQFLRPTEVVGEGGQTLDQAWSPRPSAYLAVSVPGFPNLFLLNGPNGPVGNFSLIDVAEMQFAYIVQLIERLAPGRAVAALPEAAARFEAERVEASRRTIWVTGCQSWYLDDRGIPAGWPWTFDRFRDEMSRPRWADFAGVAGR